MYCDVLCCGSSVIIIVRCSRTTHRSVISLHSAGITTEVLPATLRTGRDASPLRVQGPSVAMVHTKVRLFYTLAHVQWPMEEWNMVQMSSLIRICMSSVAGRDAEPANFWMALAPSLDILAPTPVPGNMFRRLRRLRRRLRYARPSPIWWQ